MCQRDNKPKDQTTAEVHQWVFNAASNFRSKLAPKQKCILVQGYGLYIKLVYVKRYGKTSEKGF